MNWLTWQVLGLTAFISTTTLTVLTLLYDLYLCISGHPTITEYSRANPWLAWLLLSVIEFGVLGLAVHFMAIVKVE